MRRNSYKFVLVNEKKITQEKELKLKMVENNKQIIKLALNHKKITHQPFFINTFLCIFRLLLFKLIQWDYFLIFLLSCLFSVVRPYHVVLHAKSIHTSYFMICIFFGLCDGTGTLTSRNFESLSHCLKRFHVVWSVREISYSQS